MIHEPITSSPISLQTRIAVAASHEAGAALGFAHRNIRSHGRSRVPTPTAAAGLTTLITQAAASPRANNAAWVLDNFRLILGAEKEARDFALNLRDFCVAADSSGAKRPASSCWRVAIWRPAAITSANRTLRISRGVSRHSRANDGEIWSLKPALQLELIDRLPRPNPVSGPVLISSLRKIGEMPWRRSFRSSQWSHHVLSSDPAGAYSRMDFDSRDRYRKVLAELAKHSPLTESKVAEAAIRLCRQAGRRSRAASPHSRWLLSVGSRPAARWKRSSVTGRPWRQRMQRLMLQYPTVFYLAGIELLTLFLVFAIFYAVGSVTPAMPRSCCWILPATQAAADFMNYLATFLVTPRGCQAGFLRRPFPTIAPPWSQFPRCF